MSRAAVRGWKGQAILVQRRLTQDGSAAADEGPMPDYAERALAIATAGATIAGFAKKRWRDGDPGRMDQAEVTRLRAVIDAAFDDLASILSGGRKDVSGTPEANGRAADAAAKHGLLGLTALALIEEAGELAEPLAEVAIGRTSPDEARSRIEDEAADLRTWMHLLDTSLSIDPVSTTQAKWDRSFALMPKDVRSAIVPRKLEPDQIAASMSGLARTRPDNQPPRRTRR